MRQILFADTDAGISDNEAIFYLFVFCRSEFFRDQLDALPLRRVFDGVAGDIDQDLLDPQVVCHYLVMMYCVVRIGDRNGLVLRLQRRNILDTPENISEIAGCQAELHFSAFDLGDIKNIVDQREQKMAGGTDLIQRVRYDLRLIPMAFGDVRITHDGVHRGADIMGHVGKKIVFRAGSCIRHMFPEFLLALHLGVDVGEADDQSAFVPVFQKSCLHADIRRNAIEHKTVFCREVAVPFDDFQYPFTGKNRHKAISIFRIDQCFYVSAAQLKEVRPLRFDTQILVLL